MLGAFSYTKSDRIVKRADFEMLRKSGKKIYGEFFVVHYLRNGLEKSRLGVTVSKKVGCAVTRNRMKRLIREYFRLRRIRFMRSYDMNVIARAGTGNLPNRTVYQALEKNFLKISKDCRNETAGSGAH